MDIGQALAMMQYANQMQDYASQQRKQPNVDWSQIATQFTPQAEEQAYTLSPAAAQASTAPTLPYGAMPTYAAPEVVAEVPRATMGYMPQEASPAFAELYGAPPTPDTQQMFAYNPQAMAGVSGGMPSFEQPVPQQAQVFKMPPIPIRGAMQQPVEEPMAFSPRPPQGMTDAAPFMTMPVMPGQELAMAEQPAKVEETPEQQQKRLAEEQVKAWRPGNAFEININNTPFVVEQYGSQPGLDNNNNPQDIAIRNSKTGRVINISQENSEVYNKIIQEYNKRIEQAAPTEEMRDYGHGVNIDGQWLPAKFVTDPNSGIKRLIYKDPEIGDAVYQNLSELEYDPNNPDKSNYRPPAVTGGDPMAELRQAQKSRANWMQPKIQSLSSLSSNVQTKAPIAEVKQNIVMMSAEPLKKGEESLPAINWGYKTEDGIISLEQAQKQGIVPPGTLQAVQQSEQQLKSSARSQALAMSQYQQVEPEGIRDVELRNIGESLQDIQDELNSTGRYAGNPAPSADRITVLDTQKTTLESRRDALRTATSAATTGPSGTTIVSTGETKRAFSLNPDSEQGALAMLFGAGGKDEVTVQPTMKDYASLIVDQASSNFTQPVRLNVSPEYKSGIGALSSRLMQIEMDAYDEFGDNAYRVMNMPAKFTYYDYGSGAVQSFDGTLSKAIDTFTAADAAYRTNPNDATKAAFIEAARPFSGTIEIDGLGSYNPSRSEVTSLSDAAGMLQANPVADLSTPGRTVAVSTEAEIKGAPVDVLGAARGSGKTTPPPTPAYPYYYLGPVPAPAKQYVKYDAGFNFYDKLGDASILTYQMELRTPSTTLKTTQDQLGRSVLSDDGTLDATEQAKFSNAVSNFNTKVIADDIDGKKARSAFAEILYKGLQSVGFGFQSNGFSGFEAQLEGIYRAVRGGATPAAVDRMIQDFMNSNLDNTNRAQFLRSAMAQSLLQSPSTKNQPNYIGSDLITSTSSEKLELFNQIMDSLHDAATLFAEAGRNRSLFTNGSGYQITWFADPFSRNADNTQSIITIPTAAKDGLVATSGVAAANLATQIESIKNGSAVNTLQTDPTMPAIFFKAPYVFGTAATPIYELWDKVDNDLVAIASRKHQPNMQGLTSWRYDDDNTNFPNSSKEKVSKSSADALIFGSAFTPKRRRRARAWAPSAPWPTFR
jgi:hypothetical protein